MSRLGKFVKTPDERKRYVIDYTDWLDTGEELSTVSFSVTPDGNLDVDASAIDDTNKLVAFFVSGGAANTEYEVLVTATTDGGQIKENEILFSVRDL